VNCLTRAAGFSPAPSSVNPNRSIPRRVEALVLVLDDLLVALASGTNEAAAPPGSANGGWLRPLALVAVELEYSVRHRRVYPGDVGAACDAVRGLLDDRSADAMFADFAARYAIARARSAALARMHAAALVECHRVSFLTKEATELADATDGSPTPFGGPVDGARGSVLRGALFEGGDLCSDVVAARPSVT
jgi:hypothetical protein